MLSKHTGSMEHVEKESREEIPHTIASILNVLTAGLSSHVHTCDLPRCRLRPMLRRFHGHLGCIPRLGGPQDGSGEILKKYVWRHTSDLHLRKTEA